MNDLDELGAVLERATDRIHAPGRAAEALAEARRRRVRQRGALAGLVAAAAVLAVVVGVRVTTGPTTGTGLPPAESPSSTPSVTATAPPIPASAIQPVWDPRGAEGLPIADLGVPRVMESLTPGVVTRPVAVLDDGQRALLVAADGVSEELALPDGLGADRTVSISPDGTRLAAVGASGFFWRTLDGAWQRIDLDDDGWVAGATWTPDSTSVQVYTGRGDVLVDLDSGEQLRSAFLRDQSWGLAPDGSIVTTSLPGVREWDDGKVVRETLLGPLENLQSPIVGDSSIAAARADALSGDRPARFDVYGLIALDRDSLATRGLLPVQETGSWYVDSGNLSPVAWLDEDTVAFTVLPRDAAREYLLTWNVETGEISRVSCWPAAYSAVFATDLLSPP